MHKSTNDREMEKFGLSMKFIEVTTTTDKALYKSSKEKISAKSRYSIKMFVNISSSFQKPRRDFPCMYFTYNTELQK